MFRSKKPLRDLAAQLHATAAVFAMFPELTPAERDEITDTSPRDLALLAWRAVEAGWGDEARTLVRAHGASVPVRTSPETWSAVMGRAREVVGLRDAA